MYTQWPTYDSFVYGKGMDAMKLKRSGRALARAAEFSFRRRDMAIVAFRFPRIALAPGLETLSTLLQTFDESQAISSGMIELK